MPELPEVETVRRGLQPVMEGARIERVEARRPDLRFPFPSPFAARLEGRRIAALGRRAKYLVMHIDGGPALICHLGMSGSFRIERDGAGETPGDFHHERSKNAAHDHVVFHLSTSEGQPARVVYNDPRRFGFMLFAEGPPNEHAMLAGLGVEPTGNALDGPLLAGLLRDKKAPLKAALLDQSLIAGLGNIYVSEALWRAGLSPLRLAGTLGKASPKARAQAEKLADAIRAVIADAIAAGGSSLRDHRQADGSLGYFQHSFAVYDREGIPCPTPGCSGTVRRIVQSGRSTFYCPTCQK
ncbi:MAG: bifunctional DNA-formamidopyrimidine glycosylase/DNA-(apurinic or apyrimidinic site) lyase [Mesorhizobium sp.]|nr:bifunctional DNA-formamidopyrimidine glycosylase/DNA-(apurinic or apyrimidinic site) lyase [Mesorhizobium sp.]MBN9241332.1 bifunctional DNA-formamidopyrimidine glycosylase/DNA-(apurinic or apyrimidinic site) lyase [Mesorhizobium sp.]MBN9275575.1 bifunctional DNA-formamidopyrimidine glycosylase/DNA-(apurinic or apyrimidinic site) lyase [Mesorhizobium sp.]